MKSSHPSLLFTTCVITLLILLWSAVGQAAESDKASKLFSDDFNGRTTLGDAYSVAKAKNGAWSIKDGVLIGKQTESDHGTVIRTEFPFDDVDIQFDFRFRGGKSFNFVIDDKNEESVHAGHICRVSVNSSTIRIGDDKIGSMNLEVRKMRQSKDLPEKQQTELSALLKRTQAKTDVQIKSSQWHHLRIRIQKDVMTVVLDGDKKVSLKSPGIDHPTKNKLGFTVIGTSIDFDNFTVHKPDN